LVLLPASAANTIGLSVTAPETRVLIGEPVKLELRWRVPHDVDVHLDNEAFGLRFLQVWIDAGMGRSGIARLPVLRMRGSPCA
jgi:hypothetical protein